MKCMEAENKKEKNSVVEIVDGGPLKIKGRIVLRDIKRDITVDLDDVSLCLCGKSKNPPFCDDSHNSRTE